MKALGNPLAVAGAVREDAEAEVDRIERECAAAIARMRTDEATDVARDDPGDLDHDARIADARREAREQLAQEDLADAREALDAREAFIQRAAEKGREKLRLPDLPDERRDRLARLARAGLDRLPVENLAIEVSPDDASLLGDDFVVALHDARAIAITVAVAVAPGGCRVRTTDGRVVFDNTLAARESRFEAAWRTALAGVYEAEPRR